MTPLDLTLAPPRSAHAEAAGIVFLPRTIDKIRATLPGGKLGEYNVGGFSETMIEELGLTVASLTAAVADAATEDDLLAMVRREARPGGDAAWNRFARNREIYNGDRADAIADFPWLADRPDVKLTLDFIDEDDRRTFAAAP